MSKCQICKEDYQIDLIIPDDLWEMIKPINKEKGAGLICGSCIMKRLEILKKDIKIKINLICNNN